VVMLAASRLSSVSKMMMTLRRETGRDDAVAV
jgi:hypothetical protein